MIKPTQVEGEEKTIVVVDARGLYSSGIGRYLRETLTHLFRDARFSEVRLLGHPDSLCRFCEGTPGGGKGVIVDLPFGFYSAGAQVGWLRVRGQALKGADVVFFPHYDSPLLGVSIPSVVTIHDLIHFEFPDVFPWWKRSAANLLLRRTVHRANRVIVDSEHTGRELLTRVPQAAGKTRAIPLGVSEFFRPRSAGESGGVAPAIEEPFLLCVGNRKPHKNLAAAVQALALARKKLPDLKLVVVGERYPGWENTLKLASSLGVRDAIVDFDEVTDEELRELYRHCVALLFLSWYEGFGLPILEAMACGAAVIASNRTSIPEVVGDAGILVDPDDHDAASHAVMRLVREPSLMNDLVRRGKERVCRFSWEGTGNKIAEVLIEAARSRAAV